MDDERTVWCGNLSEKVTEEVLYELFLQVCLNLYEFVITLSCKYPYFKMEKYCRLSSFVSISYFIGWPTGESKNTKR